MGEDFGNEEFGDGEWRNSSPAHVLALLLNSVRSQPGSAAATPPAEPADTEPTDAVGEGADEPAPLLLESIEHAQSCGCTACQNKRDVDLDEERETSASGARGSADALATMTRDDEDAGRRDTDGSTSPQIPRVPADAPSPDAGRSASAATDLEIGTSPVNNTAIPDPTPPQDADAATLQVLADFLRVGFWDGVWRQYNLTDSGNNPNDGVLTYNMSGLTNRALFGYTDGNGITEARKELVREVFKLYEAVLGIQFVETTSSSADIFFIDNRDGAYATSRGFQNGISYSLINIESSWSGGTSTYNDYTLQTIFHEVAHTLGLGHQGFYNGTGNWESDADFVNDSWQATIMSYFHQGENQSIDATPAYLQTPMAVDWLALDEIYGGMQASDGKTFGVQNAFTGNTVYGFNTNITSDVSDIWARFADYADVTASTIIDAAGIDTLDVSGYSADQNINLTVTRTSDVVASVSDVGGLIGNLTLAVNTVIENAVGGSGDDQFWGNEAANVFTGNAGDDIFYDSGGADEYRGGADTDTAVFAGNFLTYSFQVAGSFLEVMTGAVTDLVEDTIEFLAFADQTVAYADAAGGAPPQDPLPTTSITGATDNVGGSSAIGEGGLTNDGTPTFSGTLSAALQAGQNVAIYRDGSLVGNASVSGQSWTFTDTVGNGAFTWTARVVDQARGDGELSAGFTFTVDVEAPVVAINALTTDDATPALTGTVDDVLASVDVTVGGQVHAATNNGDGTWTLADDTLAPLTIGTYDVTVAATDAAGNSASDVTINELEIVAPSTGGGAGFAMGTETVTQTNAAEWHQVTFGQSIENAVVTMGPLTFNDTEPASVRVRNVTDEGFEFQIDEWDYLDGIHGTESVSWIAASEGTNEIGGLTVTAGTATAQNEAWNTVSMGGFTATPVVFAQVASDNDSSAVTTRVRNVDNDSFQYQMQEEEAADGQHAAEAIHWIAVEMGDGLHFDTSVTPDSVRHRDFGLNYDTVAGDLVFMAGQQRRDGGDTAVVRVDDLTASSATIFIEEEQSANNETNHTRESVGYLTGEEGLWLV